MLTADVCPSRNDLVLLFILACYCRGKRLCVIGQGAGTERYHEALGNTCVEEVNPRYKQRHALCVAATEIWRQPKASIYINILIFRVFRLRLSLFTRVFPPLSRRTASLETAFSLIQFSCSFGASLVLRQTPFLNLIRRVLAWLTLPSAIPRERPLFV